MFVTELLKHLAPSWTYCYPRKRVASHIFVIHCQMVETISYVCVMMQLPNVDTDSALFVLILDLIGKLLILDEARTIDVSVAASSQSFLFQCYLLCFGARAPVTLKKHAFLHLPPYLKCSRCTYFAMYSFHAPPLWNDVIAVSLCTAAELLTALRE